MSIFKGRAPNIAKCAECGRIDVPHSGRKILFHYARCERPCANGPARLTAEDAPEGIHFRKTCAPCKKAVKP